MFALRVETPHATTESSFRGAEATLGTDPSASIRRDDAGWAPTEAWVWHEGTALVVVRGDGSIPARLRVGESIEVGGARVTLTRLVPLLEGEGAREAKPPAQASSTAGLPRPSAPSQRRPWSRARGFDEELVEKLRRVPWLVASAALHVVAWVVLMVVLPSSAPPPPPHQPRVALLETLTTASEEVEAPSPVETPEPFPDPPAAPEDETSPVDASDAEPLLPAPVLDLEPPEAVSPPTMVLGTSRSLASVRVGKPKPSPEPVPTVVGADVVNYDADRADEHNRRAAAVVMDAVRRGGGALAKVLKGLRPENVLVVKGTFDEMEKTLDVLSVPYTLRSPYDLDEGYDFGRHRVVFWNCGEFPTRSRRAAVAADVRTFVKDGGYLFTTDWMVSNLLVDAFPGYLATSGRERPLPEAILDVRPVAGMERHPLLEGVFLPGAQAKWWLEGSAHDVEVKSPRVETLIDCPALSTAHGHDATAVAVTFTYGRGRVLHLLGHYYQKEGSLAGAIAAQRIALNFVRLRFSRDE